MYVGPMLRKATGLDWAGDPLPFAPAGLGRPEDGQDEVSLRWIAAHGESTFDGMIAHFEEYTDVVGDHPSNMVSTTLGLNAFALTGEPAYRAWVLEYVDAWIQRAEANPDAPGVLPSNVGLDGTIGGAAEGRWCKLHSSRRSRSRFAVLLRAHHRGGPRGTVGCTGTLADNQ